MSTHACNDCGGTVSDTADKCPHCGSTDHFQFSPAVTFSVAFIEGLVVKLGPFVGRLAIAGAAMVGGLILEWWSKKAATAGAKDRPWMELVLRPGEPPLGALTRDENYWLAEAIRHVGRIYEKRAVGQPDNCCFCIFSFDTLAPYVQFLAPFDAQQLYCEADAAVTLTAEKDKLLHDFGFAPPGASPNYSQRIQIDSVADLAFSARLAFRVVKQVYEIANFKSATFKLNIPGET